MNFMVIVKGEEREMSCPSLYTLGGVAPGALSATQDVIRDLNVILCHVEHCGERGYIGDH